nr:putative ribonuclease H-like domain-containing protein [Tanacetum cinerariifolium]
QKEDGIFLSQDKYVGNILKKFRYSDVRSSNTPMDKENPWGGCKITGKGTIKTGKLEFENVYFVKDLKYNLFSVSQICDNKNSVLFIDLECIVLGRDSKLLDDANILLRTPRQHNMYYIDLNSIVPHRDLTCLVAKASADEYILWHRRLGHLNFNTMNKLVRHNLVRGLPTKCFENDHTCTACLKQKQHKASWVRPIGTKWVLKNKKDKRGIVIKNKARLVVQGHTQEEGIDYNKVFAPVARIEAIRLFLAYASFIGFTVYQMDVKSDFLYGTIYEEVYVMQPPGFQNPKFLAKVYKVEKAMYGLHQASRAWYGTLSKYLLKNGFQRGTIDQTLFIRRKRGDFILVQVYVDDIIFGSSNPQLCREFKALMHEKFQMSAIGDILKKFEYSDVRLSMPCEALSREFSTSILRFNTIMVRLQFCDYHNMVAILEKSEHNIDFHPMVDFIEASPL